MAVFSRSRYALSHLNPPPKCALRKGLSSDRKPSGYAKTCMKIVPCVDPIPLAISSTPGPALAIGHPNTSKPVAVPIVVVFYYLLGVQIHALANVPGSFHHICATIGIPIAFNSHLGLLHRTWTAATYFIWFFWFACTPVSTFADQCLLQKITATATAPSDAQKSNMARAHNAGAAALVMHRGQENCKSSLSVGLLFSVRAQLVSTDPFQD